MSDKQDTREMFVSGNVFKTMLTLSVPAVLGMVVIGLYILSTVELQRL